MPSPLSPTWLGLVAVLSVVAVLLPPSSLVVDASRKLGNKRRDQPAGQLDMCAKDIDMKLACHCSTDDTMRRTSAGGGSSSSAYASPGSANTVDADCLILHDDFPQSDAAWLSFRQHPLLRHVTLTVHRNGFMGYLPSAVLGAQRELRSITITYAEMRDIPPHAFGNLTRLENVTLTRNHIEVLDALAFANHASLRVLNLEENEISVVDRLAFAALPQLQELVLAKNNLSSLPDEVFVELDGLATLRLNENQLSSARLTRDVFRGLGNMQTLDLSYNDLRRLDEPIFAELWSLQVLDLASNGMEHLSERALEGLANLHSLGLRNNRLVTLESGVFTAVPAMNLLDLSANHLETLAIGTMQPMLEQLINNSMHVLLINDNKFICDCRLTWMFDVRNRTKNQELRHTLERVVCHMPPAHSTGDGADVFDATATNAIRHRHLGSSSSSSSSSSSRHQVQQQQHHQYYEDGAPVENDLTHQHAHNVHQHHQHRQQQQPAFAHKVGHNSHQVQQSSSSHVEILMQLGADRLPCAEELADPTELPQSRESIAGIDLRWLSGDASRVPTWPKWLAVLSSTLAFAVQRMCHQTVG